MKYDEKPKLLIIGYARHGKDTVAEILSEKYGYTYKTSSEICSEGVIFPKLSKLYGYQTIEECFEDRGNHRKEWYDLISDYNYEDPTRLGRRIFEQSDIYCGLRNIREFIELKKKSVFDYSIWIDRSKHLPRESSESNTLYPEIADIRIDNNGTLEELEQILSRVIFGIELEKKYGRSTDL